MALITEPDPRMIESMHRITNRDRTPWDSETLLMMAISRSSMAERAVKKDCEQPYYPDYVSDDESVDRNESVVGSFFSRFKKR